jgi:predicted CoA-substrate-specific enzyme activase
MTVHLGVDVGAVSTNVAVVDSDRKVVYHSYIRSEGDPIRSVGRAMESVADVLRGITIAGCGTTGSGRHLAAALVGADLVKNEITAHAAGTLHYFPEARTIIEVGGQDSKIIIVKDQAVVDFGMNTVCAAGTGSFLDYQAGRLGMSIQEFASLAQVAGESVRISGRCAVFAETDVIEKQQRGVTKQAIARGLCEALVRNFLSTVAGGKPIYAPVIFQGGVASNRAVKEAFERELGTRVDVPEYHKVMGAIGVAILVGQQKPVETPSGFHGFVVRDRDLTTDTFECTGCSNRCEILQIFDGGALISRWGSRCGKWDIGE